MTLELVVLVKSCVNGKNEALRAQGLEPRTALHTPRWVEEASEDEEAKKKKRVSGNLPVLALYKWIYPFIAAMSCFKTTLICTL